MINLWDALVTQSGYTPQTTGVWAKVSGPGPSAPGTYNGSIDFEGTGSGTTVYTYTVSGTCNMVGQVSVQYSETGVRINDECGPSFTAVISAVPSFETIADERFDGSCPSFAASTPSDDPPVSWGAATYDDLWYRVNTVSHKGTYTMTIQIDGAPYGVQGVTSPAIAIYESCDVADLLSANTPLPSGQSATVSTGLSSSGNPPYIYIRVGRNQASTGGTRFDVNITTFE